MKLIINADDYGMDENRTHSIQECFMRGVITQTTLMVTMPWAEQAVEEARKLGFGDRIGLHLNFTEGSPLTEEMRSNSSFCDESGNFTGHFHQSIISRFFMTEREKHAVASEARAQMERYLSFQLPLRHLDSHHHSHTDWTIAQMALPVAKELGFKSIRLSRNLGHSLSWLKMQYKKHFNNYVRKEAFTTTDYFTGFEPEAIRGLVGHDVTVEMMVHPFRFIGKSPDIKGELGDSCHPISFLEQFVQDVKKEVNLCDYSR